MGKRSIKRQKIKETKEREKKRQIISKKEL